MKSIQIMKVVAKVIKEAGGDSGTGQCTAHSQKCDIITSCPWNFVNNSDPDLIEM